MSAVQAFNNMLAMFLEELSLAFPEEKSILGVQTALKLATKANVRLPLETFMESVEPHLSLISNQDEALFGDAAQSIPYLKEVDLQKHWAGAPQGTKDAIWQYLSTLTMIGMGVKSIPEDILRQAEALARDIADKFESGKADPSNLMSEVMSGVSKIAANTADLPAITK